MENGFSSEKYQMSRTTKVEKPDREEYNTIFCPNCSGSGKYFYVDRGVHRCKVCGGSGLAKAEKSFLYKDRVDIQPLDQF